MGGTLPDIGLVRFEDAETGTSQWIDTGDPAVREAFQKNMQVRSRRNADLFARSGVDTARLSTDRSYVQPLMQLFKSAEASEHEQVDSPYTLDRVSALAGHDTACGCANSFPCGSPDRYEHHSNREQIRLDLSLSGPSNARVQFPVIGDTSAWAGNRET